MQKASLANVCFQHHHTISPVTIYSWYVTSSLWQILERNSLKEEGFIPGHTFKVFWTWGNVEQPERQNFCWRRRCTSSQLSWKHNVRKEETGLSPRRIPQSHSQQTTSILGSNDCLQFPPPPNSAFNHESTNTLNCCLCQGPHEPITSPNISYKHCCAGYQVFNKYALGEGRGFHVQTITQYCKKHYGV